MAVNVVCVCMYLLAAPALSGPVPETEMKGTELFRGRRRDKNIAREVA